MRTRITPNTDTPLRSADNSVPIHYKNVHRFAIKLYKIAKDICLKIMSEVLNLKDCYNLQHTLQFSTNPIDSAYNGIESHCIWDQRFGSKYVQKLRARNLLMGLKEKSKNINPLNVHEEFAGHL